MTCRRSRTGRSCSAGAPTPIARSSRQAGGVVVSSEHERALLLEALADGPGLDGTAGPAPRTPVDVIPLPIDRRRRRPAATPRSSDATRPRPSGSSAISIRARAIARCWRSWPGCGRPSPCWPSAGRRTGTPSCCRNCGRRRAAAESASAAPATLPMPTLSRQLRDVTVPLAPHTHVSASGSINSWIAAGRRPLVPAGRYVSELDRRLPGSVLHLPAGRVARRGRSRPRRARKHLAASGFPGRSDDRRGRVAAI